MDTSHKTQQRIDFRSARGEGGSGWGRRLSSTATAAAFPIRKAFHYFRRAWKTDAYQLIAYGVIANLRESE